MYLSLGWKESQHRPQFPGAASHTLLLEMHENDRAQGEERGGAQGELGGLRHDVGADLVRRGRAIVERRWDGRLCCHHRVPVRGSCVAQ